MGIFAGLNNSTQFDPDAGAFINATGIGGIEAVAINNLVNQLKQQALWDKMIAIYPMVGGTAFTHKFNLKNTADTNAAFRLNFVGGWTHNSSGAKPDGVSGTYADTFVVPTTSGQTIGNSHHSYFSFTSNAAADDVELGCNSTSPTAESNLAVRFSDGNFYIFLATAGGGVANSTSLGYYIGNRLGGGTNSVQGWKNGALVINTGTGTFLPSRSYYLAAQNNGTTSFRNSTRGCSFASIGLGLSTADGPRNLNNIVAQFQRTLNRYTI
jgi:hypothetical protein